MGANLCSFRNPSTSSDHDHNRLEPNDSSFGHVDGKKNSTQSCPVILDLIRRPAGCLQKTYHDNQRAKKRSTTDALTLHPTADHHRQKKIRSEKTLEDWILNSPAGVRPDFHSGSGELYVFRHSSRKVHPSASSSSRPFDYRSLASKARDSFSLEPLGKSTGTDHQLDQENGASINSTSRSRNGKLTKRVSFKEEPDIFIIYSPEEAFSTDHQDSVSVY